MIEICELDENKFEVLQKVVSILENADYVSIKNGVINNLVNTNIISLDLTNMLGVNFDLDIINPKKYIKLFKSMKKSNIKLFDDVEMKRFVISNGETKLFLAKRHENEFDKELNLDSLKPLGCNITIKNDKKLIKNLIGSNGVNLLLNENKLKGILIEETGIYTFPEYENEEISEDNSELLISYGFLSIDANEYNIQLGIDKKNNYWLYTIIEFENLSILTILENVKPKQMDNILI